MPLCKEKKESIKSATIGLKNLIKSWRFNSLIDDQDYVHALSWMSRIEACTNLEDTFSLGQGQGDKKPPAD